MYRLSNSDSTDLEYNFRSNTFRLAFGYKKYFRELSKRLNFYWGAEWIHEFNISSVILEQTIDNVALSELDERRLFADTGYNTYINVPIGLQIRFSGKKKPPINPDQMLYLLV